MNKRFYRFICALVRPFYALFYPARVSGTENIPREGGFILCSNHCSNHDPFYLAVREPERCFHFMSKSNLFKWKIVAKFVTSLGGFSVDRGHSDLAAIRTSLQLLKEGHGLAIFPQGTRIKDNHPAPMLEGVSMIALRAGVPVVPDEEWMRTISSSGVVIRPRGYASRRSCFWEKGRFSKSSTVSMPLMPLSLSFFP